MLQNPSLHIDSQILPTALAADNMKLWQWFTSILQYFGMYIDQKYIPYYALRTSYHYSEIGLSGAIIIKITNIQYKNKISSITRMSQQLLLNRHTRTVVPPCAGFTITQEEKSKHLEHCAFSAAGMYSVTCAEWI